MVNFQFNLASVSGIVLAVGGAALFAVRSLRPQLARDTDVFFAAVGLLCGLILVFYGWRFDPLMQFGQVLLTGAAIFFVIENLRLRQVTTEQAKRNTPIVDSERPVSRKYQAEMEDDYAVRFDERDSRPRIRDSRRDEYEDRPRRSSVSRPSEARLAPADRVRRNRPARDERFDESRDSVDDWGESRSARARNKPPRGESSGSRRRRSVEDVNSPDDASYVDYRPIDDREKDNWE